MPSISRRTAELGSEKAFDVLAEVGALTRQGKDIISFCIGQPDFPTPPQVQEAAIQAIRGGKHGYTASSGIDELRAVVAADLGRRRGITIAPSDVVIAGGAKPFIAFSVLAATDAGAGHEVIYPVPGYPIYESQIIASGAVPVPLPLRESRDFAFDPADLEARLTPRTRLLIINTPHNPTGGILDRKTLEETAAVLRRFPDVWIYADEIYGRLCYDGEFQSIASLPGMYERTILSDGVSKTWAMTGWRIGYAANPVLAPAMSRWVTNIEGCAPHISQWAAVEAVGGSQDVAEAMRQSFRERRDLIVALLRQVPGFTCRMPGGAFYAWPNVTEACRMVGAADSEELRQRLLCDANVAVLADAHFGTPVPGEGQHLRFSYATSPALIEAGVARIAKYIATHSR
jgi:aspartate aminotransferase